MPNSPFRTVGGVAPFKKKARDEQDTEQYKDLIHLSN